MPIARSKRKNTRYWLTKNSQIYELLHFASINPDALTVNRTQLLATFIRTHPHVENYCWFEAVFPSATEFVFRLHGTHISESSFMSAIVDICSGESQ